MVAAPGIYTMLEEPAEDIIKKANNAEVKNYIYSWKKELVRNSLWAAER